MKQLLISIIIIITLTGCSYNTDFYIFNNSEQPLHVEYQTKEHSNSEPFVTDPRIVEFDKDMNIIEIKKAYDFTFESETKIISCKLSSGQALWIGRDLNFTLTNEDEAKILKDNIRYLKLQTDNELINATEENILDLFKTFDIQTVGIEIK
ncbi:hypothetical protein [Mangrovivirga cuniculi]|uniref:Uncharacterized protein n=1 Tax=Mangrovivirga cuniculi TaxID=2715131 RepID=A0A4D7JY05_9BACT|nr:hypothetical protein [Mangrovivirga cuniculi]QCK15575.1 hypothetical protein DCC35_12870 [Mangrovivirga cuniculi]